MENRIKEKQLDLFADRTSCHARRPNQFRLLLSSLAYTLLEAIRRLALAGTEPVNAYVGTLRLKLLKIGAVIVRNTRRVRFLLSSTYPNQQLFAHVAAKPHTQHGRSRSPNLGVRHRSAGNRPPCRHQNALTQQIWHPDPPP